jgi:GNAT superfamily N-acetyltransferase
MQSEWPKNGVGPKAVNKASEPDARKSESEEVTASTVPVLTELRYVQLRSPKAVLFAGRYWRQAGHGWMDVPVSPLAVIKQSQKTFPRAGSLGYRAIIQGTTPNAFQHVHVLLDLPNFSIGNLHKDARYHLRKSIKDADLWVTRPSPANPGILIEQGAQLQASSSAVREYYYPSGPFSRKATEAGLIEAGFYSGELLIFAGLVRGKLAAFISGLAVDDCAFGETLVIGDAYRATDIGSRLILAFIQACQRTDGVNRIFCSSVVPSKPGLSAYKGRMGFPAIAVPMTVTLRPGLASFFHSVVRKVNPGMYYQLYGKV